MREAANDKFKMRIVPQTKVSMRDQKEKILKQNKIYYKPIWIPNEEI